MDFNNLALNITDIIFLLIILISVIIGLFRGFAKEALALTGWFISGWLSIKYYGLLATNLRNFITPQILADAISFGIIFLILILLSTLITQIVSKNIQNSLLSPIDKFMGMIFSIIRSVLILSIITIFLEKSIWQEKDIPEWVSNSHTYNLITLVNNFIVTLLPKDIFNINSDLLKIENIIEDQNLFSDQIINNVDSSDGSYTPSDSNQLNDLNNRETNINNENN